MRVSVRMREGYGLENDKWTSRLKGGGKYTGQKLILVTDDT